MREAIYVGRISYQDAVSRRQVFQDVFYTRPQAIAKRLLLNLVCPADAPAE